MGKLIALIVALVWIALDYLSKQWALETLSHQVIRVNDYMNFSLAFNPGAAFSFLADLGGVQRWLFVILGGIICLWILHAIWRHLLAPLELFAYASILGGAIGNLIDRVGWLDNTALAKHIGHINNPKPGQVIDFIQWHYHDWYWPTFNLADAAITIGVMALILHWLISVFTDNANAIH